MVTVRVGLSVRRACRLVGMWAAGPAHAGDGCPGESDRNADYGAVMTRYHNVWRFRHALGRISHSLMKRQPGFCVVRLAGIRSS